uniref:Uncharacterized protein n=1 Tax=Arundo donax TaxID=35708 RepID=A0A0A9EWR9_ARUDO
MQNSSSQICICKIADSQNNSEYNYSHPTKITQKVYDTGYAHDTSTISNSHTDITLWGNMPF